MAKNNYHFLANSPNISDQCIKREMENYTTTLPNIIFFSLKSSLITQTVPSGPQWAKISWNIRPTSNSWSWYKKTLLHEREDKNKIWGRKKKIFIICQSGNINQLWIKSDRSSNYLSVKLHRLKCPSGIQKIRRKNQTISMPNLAISTKSLWSTRIPQ